MIHDSDWGDVQKMFGEALELPPDRRAAWLDSHCGARPEIRHEVESLLAFHERAGTFLDAETTSDAASSADDLSGTRIGPFQLTRPIGRGGMSVVYLADRIDGDFTQHVAVKIIDAPLQSPEVLRRFRAERQILAAFAHPHIVTLLDAGATPDGRACLVMEFIEGHPIGQYCADRQLSLHARIALMRDACAAVQYAHQHGVVHRDLKPANILVTADGVLKVLDFGVAKLLDDSTVVAGDTTLVGGLRPLTPNYASPEQLRGLPVTTSSDIYALGVLLYELLSGARPYDTTNKPWDELLKIVVDAEPRRPSAVIRPGALLYDARRLRGDLDAIVLKAMSKDPAARYASAQELSEDLGRFLHGQPVVARTPSIGYVLAKTARRYRATVAAGAVAIAALVLALVISLWQIRVAVAERDRARQRFDDAHQLANALIFKIHDGVQPLPGSTPVRQMIVAEALTYLERLSHDPAGDDALRLDLARGYHRIADVQGKPSVANLGDRSGARRSYERAITLVRPIRNPALAGAAAVELAQLDISLALVLGTRNPEARARVTEAIQTAAGLVRANPSDGPARRLLGSTHFQLALMLDDADALAEWKTTGEIFEALLAEQPGDADRQRNVALVQKYIASHYERASDYASALPYYTRALTLDDQRWAGHPADRLAQFDVAVDLSSTGFAKQRIGRLAEAAADLERCLAIRAELAASDSKDVLASGKLARVHERLGEVYADLNRLPEALEELQQAVTIAETLAGIDGPQQLALTEYLEVLASIEIRARHTSRACQDYRRALQLTTSLLKRHDLGRSTESLIQDRARVTTALASCETGAAK